MSYTDVTKRLKTTSTSVARKRILKTATELFYYKGIRAVGVDQIIYQAHVTRVTFYRHFASKDQLIVAYLEQKDADIRAIFNQAYQSLSSPEAILQAIITGVSEEACKFGSRGCPFINAAAEFSEPAHPARLVVTSHRTWFRNAVLRLFQQMTHPQPEAAADAFILLRDGLMTSSHLDDPNKAILTFLDKTAGLITSAIH
jgi:AcrR family transcriptional regulator